MELADQLVEGWEIHNRIHLYLLESLPQEALAIPLAKGKAVGAQFAHIHNVRLMWLKAAAPELLEGLGKLEGDVTTQQLTSSLTASGVAVASLLANSLANGGKVKNFKPHAAAFLDYLISHESHHRGQAEIALRQAGTPLNDKVSYGLWEWGSR